MNVNFNQQTFTRSTRHIYLNVTLQWGWKDKRDWSFNLQLFTKCLSKWVDCRLSNARFRMTFAICKASHYIYTYCIGARKIVLRKQRNFISKCKRKREGLCVCAMVTDEHTMYVRICAVRRYVCICFDANSQKWIWKYAEKKCERLLDVSKINTTIIRLFTVEFLSLHFTLLESGFFSFFFFNKIAW